MSQRPYRTSFFGGTVSTRDVCEKDCGVIPLPAAPAPRRGSSGTPGTRAPPPRPLDPAQQKRQALAALKRQEELAKQRKAERASRLQNALSAPDDETDLIRRPKTTARGLNSAPSKHLTSLIQNSTLTQAAARPKPVPSQRQQMMDAAAKSDVRFDSAGRRVITQNVTVNRPRATPINGSKSLKAHAKRIVGSSATQRIKVNTEKVPEVVPPGHKKCRACSAVKPVPQFLEDLRLIGNVSHNCAGCCKKKGLTGKPARMPETVGTAKGVKRTAVNGAAAPVRTKVLKGGEQVQGRQVGGGDKGFYKQSVKDGGRQGAVRIPEQRPNVPRRRQDMLDDYDLNDGFLDQDDDEEVDALAALREITRGFYREERQDEVFNDRLMEATAAEIRAEEARSKRMGRQEDLAAERELLKLAAEKERRKKNHKRKRKNAFIDDEGSEDSDD